MDKRVGDEADDAKRDAKGADEFYGDEAKWGEGRGADAKDAKEAKAEALSEDEIVDRLQAYFFEDDRLSSYFEGFIKDHCHIVDLGTDEYKLEYTDVFNDYKARFEDKMEKFITETLQCSIHDVYDALKRKVETEENSMGAFFAQILIAVTDFDVFMTVMRETKAQTAAVHK